MRWAELHMGVTTVRGLREMGSRSDNFTQTSVHTAM